MVRGGWGSSSDDDLDEESPLARSPPSSSSQSRSVNDRGGGGAVVSSSQSHDAHRRTAKAESQAKRSNKKKKDKDRGGEGSGSSRGASGTGTGSPAPAPASGPRVSSVSFLLHAQDVPSDQEDELAPPPRRRKSAWERHQRWVVAVLIIVLLLLGLLLRTRYNLGPDTAKVLDFIRGGSDAERQDSQVEQQFQHDDVAFGAAEPGPTVHAHRSTALDDDGDGGGDSGVEDALSRLARLEPPPGTEELELRARALLDPEHQALPVPLRQRKRKPWERRGPKLPAPMLLPPDLDLNMDASQTSETPLTPLPLLPPVPATASPTPATAVPDLPGNESPGELSAQAAAIANAAAAAAAAAASAGTDDAIVPHDHDHDHGDLDAEADAAIAAAAAADALAAQHRSPQAPGPARQQSDSDLARLETELHGLPPIHLDDSSMRGAHAHAPESPASLLAPGALAIVPALSPHELEEGALREQRELEEALAAEEALEKPTVHALDEAAHLLHDEAPAPAPTPAPAPPISRAAVSMQAGELSMPSSSSLPSAAPGPVASAALGGPAGEDSPVEPDLDQTAAPQAFPLTLASMLPPARFLPPGPLLPLSQLRQQQKQLQQLGQAQRFPYCLSCASRCGHVVAAVELHARDLSPVDRLLKLRALGESAARFSRGTGHLFLESVAHWPRSHPLRSRFSSRLVTTFLQGDAHLHNFGTFHVPRWVRSQPRHHGVQGQAQGQTQMQAQMHWSPAPEVSAGGEGLVFDLNDFDASFVGSGYYLDLVRLMASVAIHMRQPRARHGSKANAAAAPSYERRDVSAVLEALARSYHASVLRFVSDDSELWFQLSPATLPSRSPLRELLEKKARQKTRRDMLDRFAPASHRASGAGGHGAGRGKTRALDTELAGEMERATAEEEEQLRRVWPLMQQSLGLFERHALAPFRHETKGTQLPTTSAIASIAGSLLPGGVAADASAAASAVLPFTVPWLSTDALAPLATVEHRDAHASSLRSSFYTIKSIARRVGAGLASLGCRRFFVHMEGPTSSPDDDVILDVKQQRPPEFLDTIDGWTEHRNGFFGTDGARVARAVHALSPGAVASGGATGPDPHTAFLHLPALRSGSGNDAGSGSSAAPPFDSFVVRARSPYKGSLKVHKHVRTLESWRSVADSVGAALAAAHSRADDDYDARLVPHSFESGFARLVPAAALDEWVGAVLNAAWTETARAEADFRCWTQHVIQHPELQPDRDDDEDDDD